MRLSIPLVFLLFLLLPGCALFESTDYGPAIQANKGQSVAYEELRIAFMTVVMNSKNATEAQKAAALADIEANRNDFYGFNNALERFLVIAGDVNPDRLLELTKQAFDYIQERKNKDGS